jgi:hypothetical protein
LAAETAIFLGEALRPWAVPQTAFVRFDVNYRIGKIQLSFCSIVIGQIFIADSSHLQVATRHSFFGRYVIRQVISLSGSCAFEISTS